MMKSDGGAARQNTQASFGGNNKSPNKPMQSTFDMMDDVNRPNGPSTTAGPSGQARGGANGYNMDSFKSNGLNHQASSGKLQKKKGQNLSDSTNQQQNTNQKMLH